MGSWKEWERIYGKVAMSSIEKSWSERVKQAVKNDKFTDEDENLSQLWITDPIAEFYGVVEYKDNDLRRGPKDIYLILDGIFFTKALEDCDLELALACYNSIVKRINKLHGTNIEVIENKEKKGR